MKEKIAASAAATPAVAATATAVTAATTSTTTTTLNLQPTMTFFLPRIVNHFGKCQKCCFEVVPVLTILLLLACEETF